MVDVMAALGGGEFRPRQDIIDSVIAEWPAIAPQIEAAAGTSEGVPLVDVRFQAPVPRPPKIVCAACITWSSASARRRSK